MNKEKLKIINNIAGCIIIFYLITYYIIEQFHSENLSWISILIFPFCFAILLALLGYIFIKLFVFFTKFFFSLIFSVDNKIIDRVTNKKVTIEDFFEISENRHDINRDNKIYCSNKKDLLKYIWCNYPTYNVPYWYDENSLNYWKKEFPELNTNNDDYVEYVCDIYSNLLKFQNDIAFIVEEQNAKFYYDHILGRTNNTRD